MNQAEYEIKEYEIIIESLKKSGLPEFRKQSRIAMAQGEIAKLKELLPK